jgi:putative ABC transport system permease protein
MKFVPLIWKNVWRRKFRTTFTLLSIFIAFLLFGLLMTIRAAFSLGVDVAGLDRLVLINKVTLIMPLPISYEARLQQVDGVQVVTHQTWFNGIYQDPSNFFANIAVEPEPFLKVYPEFKLPPDQLAAWLADRQGAIVGKDLARRTTRAGSSTSTGSTTATRRSTRRSSSSATTTSRRTGPSARGRSDGTSSRSRIRRARWS